MLVSIHRAAAEAGDVGRSALLSETRECLGEWSQAHGHVDPD